MSDPRTGARFDALPPETVYAHAPEPMAESAALLRLDTLLRTGEAGPDRVRERFLRLAALSDRLALMAAEAPAGRTATPAEAERDAVGDACQLAAWDRRHPDQVAGPYGPDSEWDSPRSYVRQEYQTWMSKNGAWKASS
ncbi:hypothetical protein [Streptomyces sp. H39-C1]|uniref:hypothetical protein n=1 Tax=Streptomyces sp. H39-C1 TaxID=3004355 RepID=UPI0022B05D08|nr:hypothetical protein [Streptomyces sp. H39-C1]MCZ4103804.1 hypothetical protein [Streptomyces sp. H39-C1]